MSTGRGRFGALVAALVLAASWAAIAGQPAPAGDPGTRVETVEAVRVHGNHTTPDADVLSLAGVSVGQAVTDALVADVTARLHGSGRFARVEVRTRYASIADPTRVILVIIVEERAGVSVDDPTPGPLRRLGASTMWMPVLSYEDEYGFTYGARVSFVDVLGQRSRLSVPLTWGGERRVALEAERTFARGPITRVLGSGGITRRENPAYDVGDCRDTLAVRVERAFGPALRLGGSVARSSVSFGGEDERLATAGVAMVVDTRVDPSFPRNAIHAVVEWEQLWFERAPDTQRARADLRGFVGLVGQSVVVVRAQHVWAAAALPAFEAPFIGGAATLRGFRPGLRVDDRMAAVSGELRVPFSSPLNIGRAGVAVFADTASTYAVSERLADARFDTGVGTGLFVTNPLFSARLDVAHGIGGGTRAHFSLGVSF